MIDNMSLNGQHTTGDEYELMPLYLQDLIKKRQFSVHNTPPDTEWILKKTNPDGNVVGVASRGELVMIYGPPKSRKSTILNCITSSAFMDHEDTTLGFHLDLNSEDEILYIDTEMPMTAFHRRQMKLNKMCGFDGQQDIPRFSAFSLKPYTFRERISQIEYFIKSKPNLAFIVIDQMADLVSDINDRESAAHLIEKLSYWSDFSQAVIVGALHVSRNSKDMTGVIGHEMAKKMDSGFYLEKQSSSRYTKVTHLLSREQDVDNFLFDHNEYGYPVLVRDEHVDF
jgi:hypothetical protein